MYYEDVKADDDGGGDEWCASIWHRRARKGLLLLTNMASLLLTIPHFSFEVDHDFLVYLSYEYQIILLTDSTMTDNLYHLEECVKAAEQCVQTVGLTIGFDRPDRCILTNFYPFES